MTVWYHTAMVLLAMLAVFSCGAKAAQPPAAVVDVSTASARRNPGPLFGMTPYIEVIRYRLKKFKGPVTPFVLDGLLDMRSHGEGDDEIIEAKLSGRGLGNLGNSVRRMRKFVGFLAKDAKVTEEIVSPAMSQNAYWNKYKNSWPELGAPPPATAPVHAERKR